MSVMLERHDALSKRVCAALPFDRNSAAKLVPGFKWEAAWLGPQGTAPPRKVWSWPFQSLPVVLRTFQDVRTDDPTIASQLEWARGINAARTITVDVARALVANRVAWQEIADYRSRSGKTLYAHQLRAVKAALAAGGSRGIFHETGTGKTITGIRLVDLLTVPRDGMRVTVVVCPVTLIEAAWMPDLAEWAPDLPVVNLRAFKQQKKNQRAFDRVLAERGRVVALVNYETVKAQRWIRKIMAGAMVVFDEVSKCKGHDTGTSKCMQDLASTFRACDELSGTPAPNGNQEYWPLAKILAPAAGYDPFPGGYSAFAKEFLDVKTFERRNEPGVKHFAGYDFKTELASRIHERLAPVCEWVKKDECIDLPAKVFQRVPVALSKETASAYEEMRDLMRVEIGKKYGGGEGLRAHATNALAQMMKLRQITAGYVPAHPETWVSGSSDDAKVLVPIGREKIDWLLEKAEADDRVIMWTQFIFEAARYKDELGKAGVACETITGDTDVKDRPAVFDGFKRGDFQVLIAHPGVAKYGISIPGVSQAAYGSLSYALEEFKQSQDRIHGIGRGDVTKHSTFYLLCATANGAPTIDDDCVDVLEGKRSALELVFDLDRERRAAGFVPQDVGARIDA